MNKELYHKLVKQRPYLWWWVPDHDRENLSIESIVQGVLANGDMEDVHVLFKHLGREKAGEIFLRQVSRPRHNYRPQTINFFKKVFDQDA